MSFFKKHPLLTLFILLALIVTLLVITVGRGNMTGLESAVGNVTSVPSSGFNRFTYNVGNWFRTVFGISDLQRENAELQSRNMQLEGQVAGIAELEAENERLRQLANYVEENRDYNLITARVSGKNPGYWFAGFTINRGRDHDLTTGQVVVDYRGNLIGRVGEAGGNWSKVEAIIDPNSHISALVERTRDIIMVRGTASVTGDDSDRLCEGYFIPLDNDLLPGDVIVTSGLDTGDGVTYPKGLVIGEVTSVDVSATSAERTATIQPRAEFSSLEEVVIILGAAETAGAEEEAADDSAAGGAIEESSETYAESEADVEGAADGGNEYASEEATATEGQGEANEETDESDRAIPTDEPTADAADLNPLGDALPRGLLDSLGEVVE